MSETVFLGIEIGGTKLQLGVGPGDGTLAGLWRAGVDIPAGAEGIRKQINDAVPELLARAGLQRSQIKGVGIGFGGPVDDATRTVIKSHQIEGWDNFPLADWISEMVGWPAVLGNDADVAGLAEALFGAGQGMSPVFYITIGSGIGGGLIINGEIYRGCGRGAAEIGHLLILGDVKGGLRNLESLASGWGIAKRVSAQVQPGSESILNRVRGDRPITTALVAEAAEKGDPVCQEVISRAIQALAEGICHVIALLCPRRIVIGGGVSRIGERLLFEPLRRTVSNWSFPPFRGETGIVPAALGEEVVVHGALALARRRLGG